MIMACRLDTLSDSSFRASQSCWTGSLGGGCGEVFGRERGVEDLIEVRAVERAARDVVEEESRKLPSSSEAVEFVMLPARDTAAGVEAVDGTLGLATEGKGAVGTGFGMSIR